VGKSGRLRFPIAQAALQIHQREDIQSGPATGTATYAIQNNTGAQTGTSLETYFAANQSDPRYATCLAQQSRRLWYDGMSVS